MFAAADILDFYGVGGGEVVALGEAWRRSLDVVEGGGAILGRGVEGQVCGDGAARGGDDGGLLLIVAVVLEDLCCFAGGLLVVMVMNGGWVERGGGSHCW